VRFDFLYKFVLQCFSHYEEIGEIWLKKCVLIFMYSTYYSCHVLIKLEFSRQTVEKYSDFKFHFKKSVQREPSFPCGRTDRHDKAHTFRSFANAHKNANHKNIPNHIYLVSLRRDIFHVNWKHKIHKFTPYKSYCWCTNYGPNTFFKFVFFPLIVEVDWISNYHTADP
jgi:hypothetical protein